jgi:hypothetical protein
MSLRSLLILHSTNTRDEDPCLLGTRASIHSKREDARLLLRKRGNRYQLSVFLTHYIIAPSDVYLVEYRSALMLPLLSMEGHSLNTYIFKTHQSY